MPLLNAHFKFKVNKIVPITSIIVNDMGGGISCFALNTGLSRMFKFSKQRVRTELKKMNTTYIYLL